LVRGKNEENCYVEIDVPVIDGIINDTMPTTVYLRSDKRESID